MKLDAGADRAARQPIAILTRRRARDSNCAEAFVCGLDRADDGRRALAHRRAIDGDRRSAAKRNRLLVNDVQPATRIGIFVIQRQRQFAMT